MGFKWATTYAPAPPTTIPAKDSKNDRLGVHLFPTLIILPIIPFVKQNCIRLSASPRPTVLPAREILIGDFMARGTKRPSLSGPPGSLD